MIGRSLGHYEILELLGSGGMGAVYRAKDTRLERAVALKVLPPKMASNPEWRQRFEREARAIAAVDHPNIVTLYSVEEAQGLYFLTMQLVEGRPLSELIPRDGFPLKEFFKLAIPLADAISAAHGEGVIHRDLKPSNIMVSDDQQVRVLDFGLAKLQRDDLASTGPSEVLATQETAKAPEPLTEEGRILGTVAYMSPEQIEGRPTDHRSDIFSLGIILYELATGKSPFQGETNISILSSILKDTPASVIDVRPRLPRQLTRIIKHALEKNFRRRYQAALDLKHDLEELRFEVESGEWVRPGAAVPAALSRRLVWWGAVLAAAAIVVLAAVVGWRVLRQPEPAAPRFRTQPITSLVGSELHPALSPQGNHVAFVWDGEAEGGFDLYVKLTVSGAPLRLTRDSGGALDPAWSPDGGEIAFLRPRQEGGYEVLVVPALGGPERLVATLSNVNFHGLDWSPHGDLMAVVDRASEVEGESIFLLSTESGDRRALTRPPTEGIGDRSPVFSPDGRSLAFVRWYEARKTEIFLVSLDGPDITRLLQHEGWIRGLDWLPDGSGLVFSSQGTAGLWRLSLAGQLTQLPFGENARGVSIAASGDRLAYARQHSDVNIWRIGGPTSNEVTSPVRLLASSRDDWAPQYSPDGDRIVLTSDRSGQPQVWVCDSDGRDCAHLATSGLAALARWSPDGQQVAFGHQTDRSPPDVAVMDVKGRFASRLTDEDSMTAAWDWSPDGRWLYLFSDRSGEYQIWRIPAAGGELEQMTSKGGLLPQISDDGRFLYYMKFDDPASLWRKPVAGGEEELLLQKRGLGRSGFTEWRDSLVYLLENRAAGPTIEQLDLDSRKVRQIAELGLDTRIGKYGRLSVSPDGRWIIYPQDDGRGSDIIMVEDYR